MTLQELRAKVRQEEERIARHQGGYYMTPPIPQLQQYKDRIDILETQLQDEADRMERLRAIEIRVQRQEDEHHAAVQQKRREAAKRAEKENQEELDRQAAMTDVPVEQVAQEPERDEVPQPPLIGENEAQVVNSSTSSSTSTGASTRLERAERQEEGYWENILDIMYEYFHDEQDIGEAVSLHEG
eukprot:2039230-Amphidinium_carterae.1